MEDIEAPALSLDAKSEFQPILDALYHGKQTDLYLRLRKLATRYS